MQDLRSMAPGTGRIFGDRRMRPHPHQALKCPRCDSLNTKFCYYNNYNLSQPRHFCKSCRRYWTKGGVLRNVPVGGGCRKTKRSSSSKSNAERKPAASLSSSDSSTMTATATATTPVPTQTPPPPPQQPTEVASSSSVPSSILNYGNSPLDPPPMLESFDQQSDQVVFPDVSGSFTGLMTASNSAILEYNFSTELGETPAFPFHFQPQRQPMLQELKMEELTAGFMDQTGGNGGLTALDWQSNGDQRIFDLGNGPDQAYWNHTQWDQNDHSLYLP